MEKIIRSLPWQARNINEDTGEVTYVISTPTVDSYQESIDPAGCDASNVETNMPLCDSHNYTTLANQIGIVRKVWTEGRAVKALVKFAIDVPENSLARLAFGMVKSGYLRACSVGFMPLETLQPSDGAEYDAKCGELGLAPSDRPSTIYTKFRLLELSVCVLGANPDALQKSAGCLTPRDQRLLAPKLEKAAKQTGQSATSRRKFLDQFCKLTQSNLDASRRLEQARKCGSDMDTGRALQDMAQLRRVERSALLHDAIQRHLDSSPFWRPFWNGFARALGGQGCLREGSEQHEAFMEVFPDYEPGRFTVRSAVSGILPGDGALGTGLFPWPVSRDIFDLLLIYGAFRDLGLQIMPGELSRFAAVTGLPQFYFITPTYQGEVTINPDTSLTGTNVAQASNTIIGLIQISRELLQDERVDLSAVVLAKASQGLSAAIDYAAFSGNGNNDATNGWQTGIFQDANIATVNSAAGETTIPALSRSDFLNVIGQVTPAALQRPCRWYIHPGFIPQLLTLKDGPGNTYFLRSPSETGGEWQLVGFPVTWAAAAPSSAVAGLPNQKIAAFGEPQSYLVALREAFEALGSEMGADFPLNTRSIRICARGKCCTRQANGFATLTLATR